MQVSTKNTDLFSINNVDSQQNPNTETLSEELKQTEGTCTASWDLPPTNDQMDSELQEIFNWEKKDEESEKHDLYGTDSSEDWDWPENYSHRPKQGWSLITSTGSTLNHVVALEWSPDTVGFHSTQVLTVLTGAGVIVVYGANPLRKRRRVVSESYRDFTQWETLWGLGGRLIVPGGYGPRNPSRPHHFGGETVTAFSWSKPTGRGKALLAYMNDQDEVVIIQVQCLTFKRANNDGTTTDDAHWIVEEAGRFDVTCPHPKLSVSICAFFLAEHMLGEISLIKIII